jgi:hypothetical protein
LVAAGGVCDGHDRPAATAPVLAPRRCLPPPAVLGGIAHGVDLDFPAPADDDPGGITAQVWTSTSTASSVRPCKRTWATASTMSVIDEVPSSTIGETRRVLKRWV